MLYRIILTTKQKVIKRTFLTPPINVWLRSQKNKVYFIQLQPASRFGKNMSTTQLEFPILLKQLESKTLDYTWATK